MGRPELECKHLPYPNSRLVRVGVEDKIILIMHTRELPMRAQLAP